MRGFPYFPFGVKRKRVLPVLFIAVIVSIFTYTIIPRRGSENSSHAQRKIRSLRQLRRRAANDSSIENMSKFMETTMSVPITSTMEAATEVKQVQDKRAKARKVSIRDQFRPFKLPNNYSKTVIPSPQAAHINLIETSEELEKYHEGITPVVIHVGAQIESVQVNELEEELVVSLQLLLKWNDAFIKRANTENAKFSDAADKTNYRTLDPEFADKIWKPDLFLENLVKVSQAKLISPLITLNINPYTGTVIYITRMMIKIGCSMDFQYYPVDTQTCDIKLRSNSYIFTEVELKWEDVVLLDTSEPNFEIQLSDFDTYLHIEEFIGFFYKQISTLKFTILAKRKISYHAVQSYLPSVFFVFITWLCFLIPAKSIEVRIGIAMTTLLTLTAMFASIRESTPIVSYVKAIDIWMVNCIFFVFCTLFEFAIISYLQGYTEYLQEKEAIYLAEQEDIQHVNSMSTDLDGREYLEMNPPATSLANSRKSFTKRQIGRFQKKAKYFTFLSTFVEKWAFFVFALGFLFFNIGYWWWLLSSSNYFSWNVESDLNEFK